MKFTLRLFLLFVILLIGLTGIGFYWTLYKPLPDYSKSITINALHQQVDVHWDPYGVPHIYAENEEDLYFAAGYLHAQDRLWQMTLSQITAEGRFAEFLGEEMISFDQYQRTLGFWETAKQIEQQAPDSLIQILEQYSAGVNHYTEENQRNLPFEFALLELEPITWTPTHSIAMSRLMAWDQNMHWWSELTYANLAGHLEPGKMRGLFPVYDDEFPTTIDDAQSRGLVSATLPVLQKEIDLRAILSKEGTHFGSNAWAVNGSKTESGLPILSGDPHMGLNIPGYWYEVHYSAPQISISGATIPGTPFVVLGQNKNLAWTITNMMADDTDFFVEQVNPENREQYVADSLSTPAGIQNFEYRQEIIKVKNDDDRLYRIRRTQHGPVISDIHPDQNLLDNKVITMKWVGHEVSQELWAVYKMNKAVNIEEFEDAVSMFESPAMTFVYADRQNNIALFSGATLPVRDYNPLFFRNGWDPDYDWRGTIPFEELPRVINPEEGFVAHANNKLHTDSYPHYIGSFWEPPSRITRINQFLEDGSDLNSNYMQQMQFDSFSEHARDLTDFILPVLRSADSAERFSRALSYLENWDHVYQPTSTAATIFDQFFMNLSANLLLDDIGEEAYETLIRMEHLPVMIVTRMLNESSTFFNDINLPQNNTRDEIIRRSMAETLDQLTDQYGTETLEWRWENVHRLTLRPPLLGEMSDSPEAPGVFKTVVNNLFSKGPYPAHGHGMSINKGRYSWHEPFDMNLGASIRRIIDFSSEGRSLSVLPTGQSGNPVSTHYGDQTDMWLEGRYRYIYHDSTFFEQTSIQTMTLYPVE
ncbi:MAG: penicillin acylase family protein [Balneolaceae bacterium]